MTSGDRDGISRTRIASAGQGRDQRYWTGGTATGTRTRWAGQGQDERDRDGTSGSGSGPGDQGFSLAALAVPGVGSSAAAGPR